MRSAPLAACPALLVLAGFAPLAAAESDEAQPEWAVQSPPVPLYEVEVDVDEGTWISLDVAGQCESATVYRIGSTPPAGIVSSGRSDRRAVPAAA